jgi:hypothetical protein
MLVRQSILLADVALSAVAASCTKGFSHAWVLCYSFQAWISNFEHCEVAALTITA